MSRSLRRGALAATAIVFSIASLAACGAGNDAQTLQIKPDNAAATKGDIKVQNVLVISQGEKGKKGPASVSATVFNTGEKPQVLSGITLPATKSKVVLKGAGGADKVIVPPGGSVVLGGKGNASASIEGGIASAVEAGNIEEVVFQLSSTGDVPVGAQVVPAAGMYAGFGPTEAPAAPAAAPSGSPSGTPSGSPSGTPSGSPSGAAGASASGTPSPSGSASHAAGH
ncbi:DUF461 domain-containing protein [Streptomyces lavendulae]|uniref:DUF461 domain-containing protein n=1 Tax=Streptomyces TaxID=1883 RepID=UPI002476D202|nr:MULTISPECIES: DUF461 domain-containing protein [Streptomyces]MDH6542391.1 hypothetical protein [Streptomyces sp. SPB4]GLV81840.1 hypothetical protein Slala03_15290 [Streptomyces lavendulae subsp. lavendulae]GLX39984.1 hypothetical protein Sros01_60570 [Streptomyces roseochromogenus]